MSTSLYRKSLIIALLIFVVAACIPIWNNLPKYQTDFCIYYNSAKLFFEGKNPYDVRLLHPLIHARHYYCAYPPGALFFYRLFLIFNYPTAFKVFFLLKCLLLAGLLLLWKHNFLQSDHSPLFYVFCLFAFHSAIYIDLISGNINLFEQFFLWVAFSFYIQRRWVLFGSFLVLSSCVKMTPIVFLVLFLVTDEPRRYRYFVFFAFIFLSYLFIQMWVTPDFFSDFLRAGLYTTRERGHINPSTIAFIGDFFNLIGRSAKNPVPFRYVIAAALAVNVCIVSLTGYTLQFLRQSSLKNKQTLILFLLCLTYALIHPRFKDYAYILLIVPSYYILKEMYAKRIGYWILLLPMLAFHSTLPFFKKLFPLIWEYYPLAIAYVIWALYVRVIPRLIEGPRGES